MMHSANWIAVVLSAVSTLVIGFIWYNPKVFGKAWMESVQMTEEDAKNGNMPLIFGVSFVLAMVVAYKLSGGAYKHPEEFRHTLHGAFHGMLDSLYYALPVLITNALYEQRSWKGILINSGYWVLCFASIGAILYSFSGAGL
ncbi:MAG: hypothetical protein RL266_2513 [Bacteroidota bacterium]|jgi:hypothetical protein